MREDVEASRSPPAWWQRLRVRLAEAPPYWLTRFVFLRALGAVYLAAFLCAANQTLPLLGSDGLTPVVHHLERLEARSVDASSAFLANPTLFWIDASDTALLGAAWTGVVLALAVLLGLANALILAALWLLQLSFVHVGQVWYGFGWETQLLETGFLAIFLVPLFDPRPLPRTPAPRAAVWLLRWLVFRIMIGAGLIKLRGDPCWLELTCLVWHYETQPIPHPLSWYLHNLPEEMHRAGVAFNHFVELVVPFGVFGPRLVRHGAGLLLILFQLLLVASGNLSFLNWLTILPALACFDDSLWRRVLPTRVVAAAERARLGSRQTRRRSVAVGALVVVVALLSVAPVRNLLSPGQIMNTSFEPLRLVNTYGAFGSVGRHRNEIVLEGTLDEVPDDDAEWREYAWKCKPGDPRQRPCLVTPYHYRLDWLVWFAAMSDYERYPWMVHLVWKLLHADAGALSLLADDPFDGARPRFVRAELYRYEFTGPDDASGAWWSRRRLRTWLPALSTDNTRVRAWLEAHGWRPRAPPAERRDGQAQAAGRSL